jgi:hypothetical protein
MSCRGTRGSAPFAETSGRHRTPSGQPKVLRYLQLTRLASPTSRNVSALGGIGDELMDYIQGILFFQSAYKLRRERLISYVLVVTTDIAGL